MPDAARSPDLPAPHLLAPAIADRLIADHRRIVVTGAGGWLGLATLELLAGTLGDAFARRVVAFGSSNRVLRLRDGTQVMQRPLADMAWLPEAPTLVLHLAFLTKDRAEAMDEDAYRAANRAISQSVLEALKPIGAQALFLASSGAAAKAEDAAASPAMRLYGAMKRDDEDVFAQWARDTGHRAVIGRVYAVSGPHMNKPEAYALASFMRDALDGRPIAVRAPHQVIRSYVAIRELMSLVFALLLDAEGGVERFDSGGDPLELADVAQAVADAVPGTQVTRAAITSDRPDRYHGDGAHYAALLAQHGIAPVALATQVHEALADFRTSTL
ncbi:NAD-dependent epimerase/dehydratase family protein [Novosphingobium terrae]|uniref:NAD-dependent epimerase/dehydratase family protein n=1 Tax=Novosphingobium terrae TaxID=2726189 RepID=UPI00198031E0|nr:NAD(P)-dependent oxidoreductase [Novosphingobium terrae]